MTSITSFSLNHTFENKPDLKYITPLMIPKEKKVYFTVWKLLCQPRNLRVQFIYSINELDVKFLHLMMNYIK